MSTNLEADVIVVGGGASGITAAVAAAEKGASVILIEKGSTTGGAANMGMGIFAIESKYQKAQLVDFTKEDAFNFFMNYTHWRVDARLVRRYFGQSADTIDWLETMGVEFLGAFKYFVNSAQTWHIVKTRGSNAPAERAASNMFRALTERAEELGVQILYGTKVTKLIQDDDGFIVGVELIGEDGVEKEAECNAVIISTGGFGDNPQMIHDILGYDWGKDLHSFRIPGVQGEGLRMMWEAGAGKTEPTMELTYTTPGVTDVFKTISETMRQPNLMFNLDGKRFINEEIMNNTVYTGNSIAQQRERMAFTIVDDSIIDLYKKTGLDYVTVHHNIKTVDKWDKEVETYLSGGESETAGLAELHNETQKHQKNVFIGTLEEICEQTGINLENLKKTIKDYNKGCEESDEEFFKKHKYMKPYKGTKFVVARHFPAGYGSLGGVKVNENLEVLNTQGMKIPGLYASGTDACNIFGDSYCFFLPGNTMSFAVNSGRIAGYSAVEFMDSDEFM